MATTTRTPTARTTNSTDLLSTLSTNPTDSGDLLNDIDEDDGAVAWVPETPGEGVQGTVVALDTAMSDYDDLPVPVVVIEQADGTRWRITGFPSLLRKEIAAHHPAVGDTFAVKYFGEKEGRRGAYHHYRAAVRRNTATRTRPVPRPRVANDTPPF